MFDLDFTMEAVVFKPAGVEVPGVRVEYYIYDDGVKFHIWKNPDFPENLQKWLEAAWKDYDLVVDYVPEVDSWYAEVKGLTVKLSDVLVNSLLRKVVRASRNVK